MAFNSYRRLSTKFYTTGFDARILHLNLLRCTSPRGWSREDNVYARGEGLSGCTVAPNDNVLNQ
eukprot:scaffold2112_cov81-Skeletonema_marinoi.AAC.1